MKQLPKALHEVSAVRVVGFTDAVRDLGTHRFCGMDVPYNRGQVYKVLKGEHKSQRLLVRIAERVPAMFGLHFVCEEVKNWYKNYQQEVAV